MHFVNKTIYLFHSSRFWSEYIKSHCDAWEMEYGDMFIFIGSAFFPSDFNGKVIKGIFLANCLKNSCFFTDKCLFLMGIKLSEIL